MDGPNLWASLLEPAILALSLMNIEQIDALLIVATHTRQLRCIRPTTRSAIADYWGSVSLGPDFTRTVSSPTKMLIPFDR